MKKVCSLFILFATICIAGCSKQGAPTAGDNSLTGTWQWESTDGGIAFHIHETPATTGKNIDLKLAANGTYSIHTNGVLSSNGTYTMETRQCIHDHTNKTFIQFSSDAGFMVERLDDQHLEVSYEMYDGVGSSYRRKSAGNP